MSPGWIFPMSVCRARFLHSYLIFCEQTVFFLLNANVNFCVNLLQVGFFCLVACFGVVFLVCLSTCSQITTPCCKWLLYKILWNIFPQLDFAASYFISSISKGWQIAVFCVILRIIFCWSQPIYWCSKRWGASLTPGHIKTKICSALCQKTSSFVVLGFFGFFFNFIVFATSLFYIILSWRVCKHVSHLCDCCVSLWYSDSGCITLSLECLQSSCLGYCGGTLVITVGYKNTF